VNVKALKDKTTARGQVAWWVTLGL